MRNKINGERTLNVVMNKYRSNMVHTMVYYTYEAMLTFDNKYLKFT